MRFGRGAGLLVATALAISGLAACGDESEPTHPTTTASPIDKGTDSPSSTSSGTTIDRPSSESDNEALKTASRQRTKAGAIAFNELFWRQRGQALTTGETSQVEEYSHPDCAPCDEAISDLQDAAARGVTMNRNPNSIGKASATERSDSGFKVEFHVEAAKYHEVLEDGSRGRTAPPASYDVTTDTQWDGKHWVIRNSFLSNVEESKDGS